MLFVVFCYGLLACDEEHSKHIFAYESVADKKVKKLVNGIIFYIQGESKKSVISKNMAITTLKSIRKGRSWCVLENSA